MLHRVRRPTASLCMVLLLVVNLVDCYHVTKMNAETVLSPPNGAPDMDNIIGVTTKDGREIKFDQRAKVSLRDSTIVSTIDRQTVIIPVSQLQRVWIQTTDKARTTYAVIGITIGVLAVAAAIAIATKESCPFVYSWNGTEFVFDGEPYGGAITRGLERDDYSHLEQLGADSAGMYRLLVTNEVNETQYTNSMELMVIDHRPGARIEMDEWGNPHDVSSAVAPATARDQDGRDLVKWLSAVDGKIWEPLPGIDPASGVRQEITLTYPKPNGAKRASLVARAGTGMWGSHMIRELLQLRGGEVGAWYAAIDSDRSAQLSLRNWNIEQELYVLKLDVDEAGTWNTRGMLPGGGPFLTETRVVPLDISAVTGDSLRLRIRPPSGFWAMNSFEISYDEAGAPISVTRVQPSTARTSDDRDVLGDLGAIDDRYYAMPTTGDRASVSFVAPPLKPGTERSIFLHTRGYYRLHLPESGPANQTALQRITTERDGAARMAAESFARRGIAGLSVGGRN